MSDPRPARMTLLPEVARRAAIALLARAFHSDPFFAYLFPKESLRPEFMREVMGAFLRVVRLRGSAYCLGTPELKGIIGIQRPDEQSGTSEMVQAYAPALAGMTRLLPRTGEPFGQLLRIVKGLSSLGEINEHHPREPHYYVVVLGVDPPAQRCGIGRQLLGEVLAEADAERRIAHLETSRPANVGYYQKFGFDVVAEISDGRVPPIWVMTRPAVR